MRASIESSTDKSVTLEFDLSDDRISLCVCHTEGSLRQINLHRPSASVTMIIPSAPKKFEAHGFQITHSYAEVKLSPLDRQKKILTDNWGVVDGILANHGRHNLVVEALRSAVSARVAEWLEMGL